MDIYKIALYFATSGLYNVNEENKDCVVWAINHQYINHLKPTVNKTPLYFYRPSYHGNKFLAAQKGLFSTWKIIKNSIRDSSYINDIPMFELVDRSPLDELICNFFNINLNENNEFLKKNKILFKIIIPNKLKHDILIQLKRDGYSEEHLFPGFQGVCMAMEKVKRLYEK